MKRRISLTIALALTVGLVTLTSSDRVIGAENQLKRVADTGVVMIGQSQVLRLTVVSVDGELGGGIYGVRFRQMEYTQETCTGGVCKHSVESQASTNPITVRPGEAVSFDIPASFQGGVFVGVRGVVESNSPRNLRIMGIVFDTSTQRFVSQLEFEMLN